MKNFLKNLVRFVLKVLAKRRLKSFNGKIIAVTGSVGKTSTKDAIFTVLNTRHKVKRSLKSLNTDFGLLLTILDVETGWSSAFKWSWLLLKAAYFSMHKDCSEIMVLEFGVDKPGDMDFLTSIVKPDIAVMTNIAPVHLAEGQFENVGAIAEEKGKLISALKEGGAAILNIDNPFIDSLGSKCEGKKVITFGENEKADYRAQNIKLSLEGIDFALEKNGEKFKIHSAILGEYQAMVLLPAIICGELFGFKTEETIAALDKYILPPGRMSVIEGVKETTILDSSYNCSPESLKRALGILKKVGEKRRKVAVLGNMNELGAQSQKLHEAIGEMLPEYVDLLITVGSEAAIFGEKMDKKQAFETKNAQEAIELFKKKIQKDDLILVKGSQNNVRLERFVRAYMAHPEDANKLLVRQEKVWQAKI